MSEVGGRLLGTFIRPPSSISTQNNKLHYIILTLAPLTAVMLTIISLPKVLTSQSSNQLGNHG